MLTYTIYGSMYAYILAYMHTCYHICISKSICENKKRERWQLDIITFNNKKTVTFICFVDLLRNICCFLAQDGNLIKDL